MTTGSLADQVEAQGIPLRGVAFGVGIKPDQVAPLSDDALDWLDAHVLGGPDFDVIKSEWRRRLRIEEMRKAQQS